MAICSAGGTAYTEAAGFAATYAAGFMGYPPAAADAVGSNPGFLLKKASYSAFADFCFLKITIASSFLPYPIKLLH